MRELAIGAHSATVTHSATVKCNTDSLSLSASKEEIKRSLVTRVKQIPLSVRAHNVLVAEGIKFLGELTQLKYHELLDLHNCGRRTADELAAVVKAHGLTLGTSIPDWSSERALDLEAELAKTIAKQGRERAQTLLELFAPDPIFLEDELGRILRAVTTDRNGKILTNLWGWHGEVYRTLESVGDEFGVTRERVRQIEAKALRQIEPLHFPTPLLRAAIAVLRKEAPAIDADLSRMIRDRGVSRNDFSVWKS